MGTRIKLTADDGHQFEAYFAESGGPARRAIVLIQEIFGVNSHIRSVADDYASQGFHVIAPALFDRCNATSSSATPQRTLPKECVRQDRSAWILH